VNEKPREEMSVDVHGTMDGKSPGSTHTRLEGGDSTQGSNRCVRRRILLCGCTPPPVGGIASVIITIVESKLAEWADFTVFSTSQKRWISRRLVPRIANSLVSRLCGFDGLVDMETRCRIRAFTEALAIKPDLVHLHCAHGSDFWLAVLLARISGAHKIPTLLHLHGLYDVAVPRFSWLRKRAFRAGLRVPDKVIVLSERWRAWFGQWLDLSRTEVLWNCVDTRRFPIRKWDTQSDLLRLLFVGTGDPQRKGAYDILAIAQKVVSASQRVRFVFVGRDPEQIENRFVRGTALEPHFEFTGSLGPEDTASQYAAADVLLLPSYSEGLPLALLEGMAAGLPVVATPVNGIPEAMADRKHGIMVPPGDRPALLAAVLELVQDRQLRERMGRAGRARIDASFDSPHFADALGRIYLSLIERRAVHDE
jgi:glycosyltransferase involved in cell wall biosynthesis